MIFDEKFEVKNGIIGVDRDIFLFLVKLMKFKEVKLLRNLFGVCQKDLVWIKHKLFFFSRKFEKPPQNVNKLIIVNKKFVKLNAIKANPSNFRLDLLKNKEKGSVFLNILIKNIIFECVFKISKKESSYYKTFSFGIATSSQLNKAMEEGLGGSECGGCIWYGRHTTMRCNGKESMGFNDEVCFIYGEEAKGIVNNAANPKRKGFMYFYHYRSKVPHCIVNIPRDGVYLGFSMENCFLTVDIVSLCQLRYPPLNRKNNYDDISITYDFNGFDFCLNRLTYESGESVCNAELYFEDYCSDHSNDESDE